MAGWGLCLCYSNVYAFCKIVELHMSIHGVRKVGRSVCQREYRIVSVRKSDDITS